MRLGLAVLAAGAVGCGSAGRSPVIAGQPETPAAVISSSTSTTVRLSNESRPYESVVRVRVDTAWTRLNTAWRELSIPVGRVEVANLTVRSTRFRAPRFAARPLHEYFDCGNSIAGMRADLWDVYLEVTSAVRPDVSPNESRVSTVLVASARPRDGSGTQPVPCTSLGRLERLIAERMQGTT